MNIFNKDVDDEKVQQFVKWFFENEKRIRNSVENSKNDRDTMMNTLNEVEDELAKIYREGYKGQIEFEYGGKDNKWELYLYHKNKKFLINATTKIASAINSINDSVWKVITEK